MSTKEITPKINPILEAAVMDILEIFQDDNLSPEACLALKKGIAIDIVQSDEAIVPDCRPEGYFNSLTGLTAQVIWQKNTEYQALTINGKRIINNAYTVIHFSPEGRHSFNPNKMTDSLTKGIQGLIELCSLINNGEFKPELVFIGKANINMALIAQRLGFKIVDQCLNQDGSVSSKLKEITVAGNLSDIKINVEKIQKSGVYARLIKRNQKLQLNVNPAGN